GAGGRPGMLGRGHGGGAPRRRGARAGEDAAGGGDEPPLLAERAGCPVWIGSDRAAAGRALCAAHPECNVILCDDGLQHYRLRRDFEIAVEDERGAGNGLLLPPRAFAGPPGPPVGARVMTTTGA